jgi:hypothetical protein
VLLAGQQERDITKERNRRKERDKRERQGREGERRGRGGGGRKGTKKGIKRKRGHQRMHIRKKTRKKPDARSCAALPPPHWDFQHKTQKNESRGTLKLAGPYQVLRAQLDESTMLATRTVRLGQRSVRNTRALASAAEVFKPCDQFERRHIGPSPDDQV